MYPQSKYSGYDVRAEITWPPPALRSVPLTYENAHAGMRAYAAPKSGGRWMTTFSLVFLAFGGGVFARPSIETQVRDLPWGASLPLVGLVSSSVALEPSAFEPVFQSPTPSVTATSLPTPRVTSIATPSEVIPAPSVRAARTTVSAERLVAPVLRTRRPETRRPRLAQRHPVQEPKAVVEPTTTAARSETAAEPTPAIVQQQERVAAPAPDSLDSLMNRAFVAAPESHKSAQALMRFPNERPRAVAARAEPSEAPKLVTPERITGDVTAAAAAAAKASAASATSSDDNAVVLPKIPSKVRLSDDPLSGLNGKEIEGKRQAKTKPTRRK